jgi:glycyl-tRNA synthetase beta chain
MGKELLLEVGTEEIPAAFLSKALTDMEEMIRKELDSRLISHGKVRTMATPRRLVLHVDDVAEKQQDQVLEKMGPAKRVAFDKDGRPLPAALGFARGQGVDVSALETISTEKGEYLCVRKEIAGEDTRAILPVMLPAFITSIPFRKSMRWADFSLRFARPVHWILALYGGETIPFTIENIVSGNKSQGHRFMSPAAFEVRDFSHYLAKTKENYVIPDPEERRRIILTEAEEAARRVGGSILRNDALLETVTHIVEYPTVICGSFDERYLALPREVLATSMMSHQKYFPVVGSGGNLLPHFVAVSNTPARDLSVVRKGNEKVIRARLSDAAFFFEEDRKIPLAGRVERLRNVVFHSLLGTSYEKIMRFRELAAAIAGRVNPALSERVHRAATLAKADLDTQMVAEFTELQGTMGREYALLDGEDPVVARAIYEHYLPLTAGGELPLTDEGAIVGIADKMDTIVGFFGVNLVPTGAADPYALRRQALGIINILLDKKYPLQLDDLVGESLQLLQGLLKRTPEEVKGDVLEFFRARFENQLISQGHPYDVVDAVLAAGSNDVVSSFGKIAAMDEFTSHADYEPLAVAFKRVVNITRDFSDGAVDPGLFEGDAERDLYDAFLTVRERVSVHVNAGDYSSALMEIAGLRKPVDAFFAGVLVMAEDEKIRFNRLSLLKEISAMFHRIADFSRIVTASG